MFLKCNTLIMIRKGRTEYFREYNKLYLQNNKRVKLTLSMEEYNELLMYSNNENTKPTNLIKNMILSYFKNTSLVPHSIENELKELRYLIWKISNNINQIAYYSNSVKVEIDKKQLMSEIYSLNKTIADFTKNELKRNDY